MLEFISVMASSLRRSDRIWSFANTISVTLLPAGQEGKTFEKMHVLFILQ